jgi:hypothetical protein
VATVAFAAFGSTTGGSKGCGCDPEGAQVAVAGSAAAAFAASDGLIVRADAMGNVVRRTGALAGSRRSGAPPTWLAVGGGRLWVSQFGVLSALRERDLAPVGRPVRLFSDGGDGPVAVAAGAVWGIRFSGGDIRGADPARPARVWSVGVGRGTVDLAARDGTLYAALISRVAGKRIAPAASPAVVAVDAATRRVVWRRALGFEPYRLAVGPDIVWATGGRRGEVAGLSPTDGRILVRAHMDHPAADLAATASGAVALTHGGLVGIDARGDVSPAGLPVAPHRGALVAGAGSLWLAEPERGPLRRLGPLGTERGLPETFTAD